VGQKIRCPWCGVNVTVGDRAPLPPAPPAQANATSPAVWVAALAAGALALLFLGVLAFSVVLLFGSRERPATRPADESVAAIEPGQEDGHRALVDGDVGAPEKPAEAAMGRATEPAVDGPPKLAMFMGAMATGSRFCIVADVSGSMKANNRMGRLKAELEKTLKDLGSDQWFSVIVFHSRAEPMPGPGWLSGGADVQKVLPWIHGQKPNGGTQPMTAFERAFRLDPRPDGIFFMTDGIIPPDVPPRVVRLNGEARPRVPIHSILFGGEVAQGLRKGIAQTKQRAEKLLRQLSDDSGGTYRFVPDAPGR
jgi:hypothetical protein